MIAIPIEKVEKVIGLFQSEINVFNTDIKVKLNNLLVDAVISVNADELSYVNKLIQYSDDIITATPIVLKSYQTEFDNIINSNKVKTKKGKKFREKILTALSYTNRRSDFYPQYFQKIGIKACVYCNSQLTVCIDSEKKKQKIVKAKFQVDHYLPKSEYPCFSISLFNLYPVCASCNNSKSAKNVSFNLYENTKNIVKSKFEFRLTPSSKAKYLLNRKLEEIELEFSEPVTKKKQQSFKDTFDIKGIYDTQKDIAEELILKAEIYTDTYKKSLIDAFPEIFTSSNLSNRLIIGSYSDENDIHKRAMSKFTQDIAKQLGLI